MRSKIHLAWISQEDFPNNEKGQDVIIQNGQI